MSTRLVVYTFLVCLTLAVSSPVPQSVSPEALRRIFEEFRSSDLEVKKRAGREGASYAAQWVGQDVPTMRASLPVILEVLNDSDPVVRLSASAMLSILGQFRSSDALAIVEGHVDDIIARFDDPNDQVAENLIRCLALAEPAPPAQVVQPLIRILRGPNSRTHGVAAVGLARAASQSPAAADAITGLLDEVEDLERRRGIVEALALAKPTHPTIISKLVAQLDEQDELLLQTTVRALGEIGRPAASAAEKLRAISINANASQDLRLAADGALRSIEGRSSPPAKP